MHLIFDDYDAWVLRATVPVVWTASGENKLKAGSRLLVSPFPEIKFILSCCGVL
jgi:hypothetical protein